MTLSLQPLFVTITLTGNLHQFIHRWNTDLADADADANADADAAVVRTAAAAAKPLVQFCAVTPRGNTADNVQKM